MVPCAAKCPRGTEDGDVAFFLCSSGAEEKQGPYFLNISTGLLYPLIVVLYFCCFGSPVYFFSNTNISISAEELVRLGSESR